MSSPAAPVGRGPDEALVACQAAVRVDRGKSIVSFAASKSTMMSRAPSVDFRVEAEGVRAGLAVKVPFALAPPSSVSSFLLPLDHVVAVAARIVSFPSDPSRSSPPVPLRSRRHPTRRRSGRRRYHPTSLWSRPAQVIVMVRADEVLQAAARIARRVPELGCAGVQRDRHTLVGAGVGKGVDPGAALDEVTPAPPSSVSSPSPPASVSSPAPPARRLAPALPPRRRPRPSPSGSRSRPARRLRRRRPSRCRSPAIPSLPPSRRRRRPCRSRPPLQGVGARAAGGVCRRRHRRAACRHRHRRPACRPRRRRRRVPVLALPAGAVVLVPTPSGLDPGQRVAFAVAAPAAAGRQRSLTAAVVGP